MALNFLDYALSVAAGAAEKDMAAMKEERNANFNLALEEFKDNNKFKKVGRNEKCPCGSGKKFKFCHGDV